MRYAVAMRYDTRASLPASLYARRKAAANAHLQLKRIAGRERCVHEDMALAKAPEDRPQAMACRSNGNLVMATRS